MKTKIRPKMVRIDQGRGDSAGSSSLVKVAYVYALLAEKGSMALKSWSNIPHHAWDEDGFQARLLQLMEEFQGSGLDMALIALTRADTHTEGLKVLPLEGMNRVLFFKRHPARTLKVIATFAPRTDGAQPAQPRVYVGVTPGGDGFCQDERRVSEA